MDELVKIALSNGIFAGLFTFLLFYVLKDANKREKKYTDTIEKLTDHLGAVLNEVKSEVSIIKIKLDTIGKKFNEIKKEQKDEGKV